MAFGINSYIDIDHLTECPDCDLPETCCAESCEARLWVGPCGSIDYQACELNSNANFYEPQGVYLINSVSDNAVLREKNRQGCKKFRTRGMPDLSFDVTWDICQSDFANGFLLGRCPFDYVLAPKANNINFESQPLISNQTTKVWWGRVIGDTYSWDFPEDDCQSTTRTFLTSGYCCETQIEALIP